MRLYGALQGLQRITQKLRPGTVVLARRAAGRSCDARTQSECPPCVPPPRPACRAEHAEPVHAVRVVCCPPPQGARPPCCGPTPKPALTCSNRSFAGGLDTTTCRTPRTTADDRRCGHERDRVARRHALAEETRRRDYEREAALVSGPPAEISDPYRLGAERECARATDGRHYAIACESQPAARCGPGRVPPPPRCIELAPDSGCQIRAGTHMDPCAHRPRVLVEIDRSGDSGRTTLDPSGVPAASHAAEYISAESQLGRITRAAPTAQGLTSRFMKSLNLGKGAEGATCARKSCTNECAENAAHKAGDSSRCTSFVPPAPATPPCRHPSLAERIRKRTSGPYGASRSPRCGRKIHTSAAVASTGDAKCGSKSTSSTVPQKRSSSDIDGVLRERAQLKEAGRGRVISTSTGSSTGRTFPAGGGLELRVPPGAERVRVRVSMEGAGRSTNVASCVTAAPASNTTDSDAGRAACSDSAPTPGRRDSWLSIKTIQKKLSGCRLGDDAHSAKQMKSGAAAPPTRNADVKSPCASPSAPKPVRPPCTPPSPAPVRPPPPPCSRPSPSPSPNPSSPGCGGSSTKPKDGIKRFSSTLALVTNTL